MSEQSSRKADAAGLCFRLLNEIGIIAQLSRTLFEKRLPDGLTVPHFSVLNHLVRLGDAKTPRELARAFQVPKTTMTHTLAGLEARGYMRWAPNPSDGRSKLVMLTPEGVQFRDEAILSLCPDIADLMDRVPLEEIERLLPGLEALRAELDAMRDA